MLAHCRVSSQVFTTCYALNAHDLIEESHLLEKKSRANATLPLSCNVALLCTLIVLDTIKYWIPGHHSHTIYQNGNCDTAQHYVFNSSFSFIFLLVYIKSTYMHAH